MTSQILGKVTWFNDVKGYGELISEDKKVYFFSWQQLCSAKGHKTIQRDTVVTFIDSGQVSFGHPVAKDIKVSRKQLEFNFEISHAMEESAL